jgi:hypothetical protein
MDRAGDLSGDLVTWPAIGQSSGRAHVKGRAIWRATVSAGDAMRANGRSVDPMASDWAGDGSGGRCAEGSDFAQFFAKV